MFDKRQLKVAYKMLKIGSDWIGLDRIGSDWIGLDWIQIAGINVQSPQSESTPRRLTLD